MMLEQARAAVAAAARELSRTGLVQGTAGNVSMRDAETGLIAMTPSAVAYDALRTEDVAVVDVEGQVMAGTFAPSTETPMHTEVYRRLPWVAGVVHTHSVYATTLACLNRPIEPVHYLIALVGKEVPVAPYATYGTAELGQRAVETLGDGLAVLLRQHGVLTVGHSLAEAMTAANVTEYVAEIYYRAIAIGQPARLPDGELERLRHKIATYKARPRDVETGQSPTSS